MLKEKSDLSKIRSENEINTPTDFERGFSSFPYIGEDELIDLLDEYEMRLCKDSDIESSIISPISGVPLILSPVPPSTPRSDESTDFPPEDDVEFVGFTPASPTSVMRRSLAQKKVLMMSRVSDYTRKEIERFLTVDLPTIKQSHANRKKFESFIVESTGRQTVSMISGLIKLGVRYSLSFDIQSKEKKWTGVRYISIEDSEGKKAILIIPIKEGVEEKTLEAVKTSVDSLLSKKGLESRNCELLEFAAIKIEKQLAKYRRKGKVYRVDFGIDKIAQRIRRKVVKREFARMERKRQRQLQRNGVVRRNSFCC